MLSDATRPAAGRWRPVLGGALSGLMLFASDYPWHAWPLQAVALLPFLAALQYRWVSAGAAAIAGTTLGACYLVPLAVVLRFPLLLGVALALYLMLLWIAMALALRVVLRWPSPLGPLAAGAAAVLVEWFDFSLVPVWGTAQSFVRVWTAAPATMQLVSLTGVLGLVFVAVAGQALVLRLALGPRRLASAVALAVMLALAATWSVWRTTRQAQATLHVAAIGWTRSDLTSAGIHGALALHERLYSPLVRAAAAEGARLVVSPEVGFVLDAQDRHEVMTRTGELARMQNVWLAVGYLDLTRHDNRLAFIGPDGAVHGEYAKTHLIPFIERYPAGDGSPVIVDIDGARVGGLICQDDNFADLARAYGRRRVQVMAVPTNDWREVSPYHLENARFRPVENGYALVRAASNGISVIMSPGGELLARRDHFREGPGVIAARVPLDAGGAPYSWAGDWIAAAALVLLAAGAGLRRRGRPGATSAKTPSSPRRSC